MPLLVPLESENGFEFYFLFFFLLLRSLCFAGLVRPMGRERQRTTKEFSVGTCVAPFSTCCGTGKFTFREKFLLTQLDVAVASGVSSMFD